MWSDGKCQKEGIAMKAFAIVAALLLTLGLLAPGHALSNDDSKVNDEAKAKQGANQVESGAKQIGQGVVDTAKGIGKAVQGGAETAGDRIKEAGEAAKPEAKTAWGNVRDGAASFGQSVKTFFTRLFRSSPRDDKERTGS
jgi:hypothetical protein